MGAPWRWEICDFRWLRRVGGSRGRGGWNWIGCTGLEGGAVVRAVEGVMGEGERMWRFR